MALFAPEVSVFVGKYFASQGLKHNLHKGFCLGRDCFFEINLSTNQAFSMHTDE